MRGQWLSLRPKKTRLPQRVNACLNTFSKSLIRVELNAFRWVGAIDTMRLPSFVTSTTECDLGKDSGPQWMSDRPSN